MQPPVDGSSAAAVPAGSEVPTAAAAPRGPPPRPSVEQCRVLQQAIRLLEHTEEAKKMLPLAAMTPEVLQATLINSPQPVNVADVLTKLAQHLEPPVAAQLWAQFRAGGAPAPGPGAAAALPAAAAPAAAPAAPAPAGDAAPNQAAPLPPGAPNPAHAKLKRGSFAANASKCGVCNETYHATFSPLLLCDFCPAAFHVCCLGLDWADLPEGEWACPKCLPQPNLAARAGSNLLANRLLTQQQEAMLRAFSAGGGSGLGLLAPGMLGLVAPAPSAAAASSKEARDRRKAEESAAREVERLREREAAARAKADAKRAAKYQPDDKDLAAQEAAEAARLSSLLPQLQAAAQNEAAGSRGGRRSGRASVDDEDELPLLPGGRRGLSSASSAGGYASSAADQLREANDRLRRLQASAAGPPPLPNAITDQRQLHALMDGLAVSEFLASFAVVCGAPHLSLLQLFAAVAWPLDGPDLANVYTALLKYLLAQWSHIQSGHVGARVKRWARCLDRSCALGAATLAAAAASAEAELEVDDDEAELLHRQPFPHPPPNGNATWQELLRRYCLLSRSSLRVSTSQLSAGGPEAFAAMSDDLIAVHAAVELGKRSVWALPPEFHLRLLHALCNDVLQCFNMKAEIGTRLDTSIQLQADKFHADADERRREREAARARREAATAARDRRIREQLGLASGGELESGLTGEDGSVAEPPHKRARSSSGGLEGSVEGTPSLDGEAGGRGWAGGESGRDAREAALYAELARHMIRTEPLGSDRHYQRYWHFQSHPSIILVEGADGDRLGVITSKQQLDQLMGGLNRRGAREAALFQTLQRRYSEFCRVLRPPLVPLDVRLVPRGLRRRWLRRGQAPQQHWLDAAAAVLPANTPLDGDGWPVKQEQEQQQPKRRQPPEQRDLQELLTTSEAAGVAAAVSELEALVSQLVGVGLELCFKDWRRRLRGRHTVEQLCDALEELEAALSRLGDGRPPNATPEALAEFEREADTYEAEFVMPVSAAELAEQQEAAAAAAAASAAAAAGEAGADGDGTAAPPPAPEAPAKPPPAGGSKSKKKGAAGGAKKAGARGAARGAAAKKGGAGSGGSKKAGAGAGDAGGDDDDALDAKGPTIMLLSGATRVRKKGAPRASGSGGGAAVKLDPDGPEPPADCGGGEDEGARPKAVMVCPLEELDDSDVEAEKRYLEKRAAEKAGEPLPPPPVVLWRSLRELGVWLKDLRRARAEGALAGAAFAASALVDRGSRLMLNLAVSRVRTGVAHAIAEDRDTAVARKTTMLLGPTSTEERLRPPPDPKAEAAGGEDSGSRQGGSAASRRAKAGSMEPKGARKVSARQRSKQRSYATSSGGGSDEDEYSYGYGGGADSGSYGYGGGGGGGAYGYGYEEEWQDEPMPMPEGKYGLECICCGGGGDDVACCEVPGCSVLMHLSCSDMDPDCEAFYCPDHAWAAQQPWLHAVPPPDPFPPPPAPPVRPNVPA